MANICLTHVTQMDFLLQSPSHLPWWVRSVYITRSRISHAWAPLSKRNANLTVILDFRSLGRQRDRDSQNKPGFFCLYTKKYFTGKSIFFVPGAYVLINSVKSL
jgi:hypothetical protein